MLFNSSEFIFVFLPLAVLLHFALARWSVTAAVTVTTLTSLLFYAWWSPPFVLLPILSIAANFLIAQAMRRSDDGTARRLLIIGIVANLAVLGWFKYGDFLVSIFEGRKPNAPEVPLALSFTTFVQIAFLVDVWRRREQVNFPTLCDVRRVLPPSHRGPDRALGRTRAAIARPRPLPPRLEQHRARSHHISPRARQKSADRRHSSRPMSRRCSRPPREASR